MPKSVYGPAPGGTGADSVVVGAELVAGATVGLGLLELGDGEEALGDGFEELVVKGVVDLEGVDLGDAVAPQPVKMNEPNAKMERNRQDRLDVIPRAPRFTGNWLRWRNGSPLSVLLTPSSSLGFQTACARRPLRPIHLEWRAPSDL